MGEQWVKDPDSVLDYTWDWETWLDGDTISTVTWDVPTGITKDSDSKTTTTSTIWLSGGSAGSSYLIGCRVVTALGRTKDRSRRVWIVEQ